MSTSRAASNVIIGGILLHLSLGTLYSWGCIQPYVTSYIRLHNPLVTAKDTTIIYGAAELGHAFTMPLVGILQFRLGVRGCAAFGAGLVSLATLLSSLAITVKGLATLNALFGVGIGIAYTCPLVCGYGWMPDRKGTVSGFVVAGYGAGAAVFNGVATAWVNPGDASPDPLTGYYDEDVAGRVPGMYLILGTCYFVLGMIGSWMLAPPPSSTNRGNYASLESSTERTNDLKDAVLAANGDETSPSPYRDAVDGFKNSNPSNDEAISSFLAQAQNGEEQHHTEGQDEIFVGGAAGQENYGVHTPTAAGVRASGTTLRTMPGHFRESGSAEHSGFLDERAGRSIEAEVTKNHRQQQQQHAQRQFGVWDLLRAREFYHLALCMLLSAVSGLFIAGNYKRIAQQRFPTADRFLSIMGSVASLFNASGRIIGGLAVDRFGGLATLLVMCIGMTCLLLSMSGGQPVKAKFFLVICLIHMLYGSNFAIYPTLTAELFGATTAGPNYGLIYMLYGIGSFFAMLWLAEVEEENKVFLACAGVSFSGAMSVALFWQRWRASQSTVQITMCPKSGAPDCFVP